jgi:hypothetical protein
MFFRTALALDYGILGMMMKIQTCTVRSEDILTLQLRNLFGGGSLVTIWFWNSKVFDR